MTETHIPQRYATNPAQIPGMTTRQLRDTYLIPDVFVPGEIRLTYTHHDRVVLGGAVPAGAELRLTGYPEIRSETFLEHRELGEDVRAGLHVLHGVAREEAALRE